MAASTWLQYNAKHRKLTLVQCVCKYLYAILSHAYRFIQVSKTIIKIQIIPSPQRPPSLATPLYKGWCVYIHLSPSLSPGNQYVLSVILSLQECSWQPTVCDPQWLASFIQHYVLELHVSCTIVCTFLTAEYYSMVWMYNRRQMQDSWVVSSFGLSKIKLPWAFVNRCCVNLSFHFSGINSQECNC